MPALLTVRPVEFVRESLAHRALPGRCSLRTLGATMQHHIEHGPAFAWLRVQLAPNEFLQAEAGAMVRQTPTLTMDTRLNAGSRKAGFFRKIGAFFVAMIRKAMGGESMFVNDFHSAQGGEVVLAPSLSGQIMHIAMDGQRTVYVQAGSYLANTGDIDTRVRFGGLRTMISGEGLTLLECKGTGDLFVNSYGGVVMIPVNGKYIVDTGHMVAFDSTLKYRVRSVGGLKSLLLSGEGLVLEFEGQGNLWIQSRNLPALTG
jgi:uncharacterized protein (TIGR00266 family)